MFQYIKAVKQHFVKSTIHIASININIDSYFRAHIEYKRPDAGFSASFSFYSSNKVILIIKYEFQVIIEESFIRGPILDSVLFFSD